MRLRVFRSDKGDCLLASDKKKHHILIDGGMKNAFDAHVAAYLGRMRKRKETLDLVYVSHVDQDHISGVLKMMDDEVLWRVHEFQKKKNKAHKRPKVPRPPKVLSVWHNAFHAQVGKNAGAIEDMLAATATMLSGDITTAGQELSASHRNLAASNKEAIQLSRRIGAAQLGIPLNREYGGQLMFVEEGPVPIPIGSMRATVIGPFDEDLVKFRSKWNTWLRANKKTLAAIEKQAKEDAGNMGLSETAALIGPLLEMGKKLGKRSSVSAPNLASLMLLLEEKNKTVLLTGDGHADDILWGLDNAGRLDANGGMHVNVLKVQHHGSEHNTDEAFCRAITADKYVFCGNGEHSNPDLDIIRAFANSRIGTQKQQSPNKKTKNKFEFFFNTHHSLEHGKEKAHMKKVETLVQQLHAKNSKLRFRFMKTDHKVFTV